MSKFRKNNKKNALLFTLAFALIIAGAMAVTFFTDWNPLGALAGPSQPKPDPDQTVPIQPDNTSTDEPNIEPEPELPITFNIPDRMRAVTIMPGADFLTEKNEAAEKVKKEIDAALETAKALDMNTVLVGTSTDQFAAYDSLTRPVANAVFDPLDYLIAGARSRGLYVYCFFDLKATYDGMGLVTYPRFDTALLNGIEKELSGFLEKYAPDGLFFYNYDFPESATAFADYLSCGGGMNYSDYLDCASRKIVESASGLVRKKAPGVQVGLIAEPQWATTKENEAGQNTLDPYSMLTDGHCDVKAMIEDGLADMIAVKAFGSLTDSKIPFERIVKWWSELAAENEVRMYTIHAADRMANSTYAGWGSSDQMTKQAITLESYKGCNGSIFYGLASMKADPAGSVTLLKKYFRNEVNTDYIMTELSVSVPAKLNYSTYEPTVLFRGASDPTNPVTVNGAEIKTDANGYFSKSYDLKPGLNTFTIVHKDKTLVYKITRNVKIFQSVAPTGSLTVDGSTDITLTAMAYENAVITAVVNGQTVTLTRDNSEGDNTESERESFYVKYTGTYRTPAAGGSVKNLGNITFKGSWEGKEETETGASIKVNKIAEVGSGSPIIVTASQAETFPTSTLDDLSDGSYYPLPKGTLDYTVGDMIVFTSGSSTYRYYKLASGLRVYAGDIAAASQQVQDVVVSGMSISANTATTTVALNMSQPTSYSVSYSSSGISFTFNYLKSACGSLTSLTKNPIFSSATWSGDTLTLRFRKTNGMCGYTASYNGNTLSLQFNNPPASIAGARIVIDPGHGGTDVGALGFYPGKHEDYVNRQIATELASILRNQGASVLLIDTSGSSKVVLQTRVAQAASFKPQIFLSVHSNSATNSSARGSEAYYFYDFSQQFCSYINSALYNAMGNYNRGAKYGLYYVTRTTQYTSVLAECGFMSNESEYVQLLQNYAQIASSLANGIGNYINSIYSGYTATGTETVGKVSQIPVKSVTLDKSALELTAGTAAQLTAKLNPEDATDQTVTWSSSNGGVVTVDENGSLKALAAGTATITVKTTDGGYTASCAVTVKPAAVTDVLLDKAAVTLKVGESLVLNATVLPENVTDKTIQWSSSAPGVVKVENGKLTALTEGNATISAKCGEKSAFCAVTVQKSDIAAESVTLDKTTLELTINGSAKLTATVLPEETAVKTVQWSSSEETVAKVAADGTVTGLKEGTVIITAKCGEKSAECTVTVKSSLIVLMPTSIQLDQTSLNLTPGSAVKLAATVLPDSVPDKSVTWSSDAPTIAEVLSDGTVTAKSAGIATITAKTTNGLTITCTVTVA